MNKSEVIDFYKSTNQYFATYHNHKETSAWAGLVLYMAFAGLMNLFKVPNNNETGIILLSVLILVITVFIFLYVSNQLKMKNKAGAYSAAIFIIVNELLIAGDLSESEMKDYLRVEKSDDTKGHGKHTLPKRLLDEAEILAKKGKGFRYQTRLMTFGILLAICILTLTIKLYPILT